MPETVSWLRRSLLMLGLCAPLTVEAVEPGMPAPLFTLNDAYGNTHQLSDHLGQWLVLYFYPKNDTPGCTTEACEFRDELKIIHQMNANVIGISVDDPESHRAFIDKYGLPFLLLSDPGGEVAARYDAQGSMLGFVYAKRRTFLIDPQGVIQHVWTDVKPSGHAREVIAILETHQ